MKNKLRILTLITLIAIMIVGCDNAETKELKSLHNLGYEHAVKEYNSYEATESIYGPRKPPVAILEKKVANESPIDVSCDNELYETYKELLVEEYQNAEKIDALESGYRKGFFDCVKNSVEFVSSKKGKKSIDNYLNGIDEVNGYRIDDDTKATVKDTIIMYSDTVLEEINLYEKENGKYTGSLTSVSESLSDLNDKLYYFVKVNNMPMRMLSRYAYMNVWY